MSHQCECGFEAKSAGGLKTHLRSHPTPVGTVVDEVRGLVGVATGPLVATALRVAAMLDDPGTTPRDATGLSRELRLLLAELEDVVDREVDALDELAQRRRSRGADSSVARGSAGS